MRRRTRYDTARGGFDSDTGNPATRVADGFPSGAESVAGDLNLDKYRHHVAHFNLPREKETELLLAIWQIMKNFVDRAFGDDPVQQCLRAQAAGRRDVGSLDGKDDPGDLPVLDWRGHEIPNNQDGLADAFGREADSQERRER